MGSIAIVGVVSVPTAILLTSCSSENKQIANMYLLLDGSSITSQQSNKLIIDPNAKESNIDTIV